MVGDRPLDRVELYADSGQLLAKRRPTVPSKRVFLPVDPAIVSGHVEVDARGERVATDLELPALGPWTVEVEAPVGQGRRPIADGDAIQVVRFDDSALSLGVLLTAVIPAVGEVSLGPVTHSFSLTQPGQRVHLTLPLGDGPDPRLRVVGQGRSLSSPVRVVDLSVEDSKGQLVVTDLRFPTDAYGGPDRARPADRVTLPAAWWRQALRSTGLGYRPRDDQAPWAWQTVTLRNTSPSDIDVVLRATVTEEGDPAPAFRSQVRSANSDAVSTLLRVPAGSEASGTLPVFASGQYLLENGSFERHIEVLPLGSEEPLQVVTAPLFVRRGSPWASLGFAVAFLTSVAGYLLLALRGPRWLQNSRTSDLVTVSLFGSLTYVVATGLQVLGMGLASILGPFSPLVMGLADDALRACLLGTLIALLPRPGIAALATLVGFLMRGLTLGAFHPVDLLYVGSAILWLEGWLWISGCTRGDGWLSGSRLGQWVRLSVGLGLSNVCATATGLAVSVVLYRLFLADWYVFLILALPGFLYVVIGARFAVDFAGALKEVSS